MMFKPKKFEKGSSFSSDSSSSFSPTAHSSDFSASIAQMDRIIHQRMKIHYSHSSIPEKNSSDYALDEMGLCENLGKMSFGEARDHYSHFRGSGVNPNTNGFNLDNDMGFRDIGGNFDGKYMKYDDDMCTNVAGYREGCSDGSLMGPTFSPQNSKALYSEPIYYKNETEYLIQQQKNWSYYNGGPQFDTLANRPCLDHPPSWSQQSRTDSVGDSSRLDLSNSTLEIPLSSGSTVYSNRTSSLENQVCNDLMFYANRASIVENRVHNDDFLVYPSRATSVEDPSYTNLMMYANRASGEQNSVCAGPMLYPSRGSGVENSSCNDLMLYASQPSLVENPVCDGSMLNPSRALCIEYPLCNDLASYANRAQSVENPMYNDLMLYPDQDLGVGHPVCNSSLLYRNRALSLSSSICNEPRLYHDQASGVGNSVCSGLLTKEKIRASQNGKALADSGDYEAFNCEDSFILQGKSLKCGTEKTRMRSKGRKKKSHFGNVSQNQIEKRPSQNDESLGSNIPVDMLPECNSLDEFRGYIYYIAKDQLGCRFLQRVFDEGSSQNVQIIFMETINHVIELMMDPFANYLIQRLLEVCREEQLTHILLMVTKNQGALLTICLNTHGTRVVQKLIETLKTRQQKRLVVSALQMGFLDLVKDVNGNHVIKSCLRFLSKEENQFIFEGAAKCCFNMATDQYGCCILKNCITQSGGRYRERLVTRIATQGFLLAQDAYGNYVIQYIIELKIPSAAAILSSQFVGRYVQLSMQKFSSHVVQKFLNCFENSHPFIIQEFLSVPDFEQLLLDPFANYVIQTAIDVSKDQGPLHALLVKAVQRYSTLRNNPYCRKIFSGKLLKK